MDNTTYILLDGIGELELTAGVPAPCVYSISEYQDISKVQAASSLNLEIPGTKSNHRILSQLFDVNIEFRNAVFDIKRKVSARLIQNGEPVLTGYFQLIGVNKRSPSDVHFDENISYVGLIFEENVDLYDQLKDREMTDLNLEKYNHILHFSAITSSSAHTYLNGYKYFHPFVSGDIYKTNKFQAAIYVKPIFDLMMSDAGFSTTSDSINNTDIFKHLMIFQGIKDLLISDAEKESREFRVSVNSGTSFFYSGNTGVSNINGISTAVGFPYATSIPFDNETTGENFDGDKNNYDTTAHTWTVRANGNYNINVKYFGNLTITPTTNVYWQTGNIGNTQNNPRPYILLKTYLFNSITNVSTDLDFQHIDIPLNVMHTVNGVSYSGLSATTTTIPYQVESIYNLIGAHLGETYRIRTEVVFPSQFFLRTNYPNGFYTGSFNLCNTMNTAYASDNNFWSVEAEKNSIQDGDIVEIAQLMPKQTKQIEFWKSLVNNFNLFVRKTNVENQLEIKPRRQCYAEGAALPSINWDKKLERELPINIKFLSELQNKTINFTCKEGKDILNEQYLQSVKLNYNQYKISFTSEFITGTKDITLIWEPTPLVRNNVVYSANSLNTSFIVPYIIPGAESNIKMLYDGGVLPTDVAYPIQWVDASGQTQISYLDWYSYAGHLDSPTDPSIDINWNTNEYYFFSDLTSGQTTDNTMFNNYWADTIELIDTSRLMTASYWLTEKDISELDFFRLYEVDNAYWILNKVGAYDADSFRPTRVELIKTIDTPAFNPAKKTVKPHFTLGQVTKPWVNSQVLNNRPPVNNGVINYGDSTIVDGVNIIIQEGNSNGVVIGSGITMSQRNRGFNINGDSIRIGFGNSDLELHGNDIQLGSLNSNIEITGNDIQLLDGCSDIIVQNSNGIIISGGVQNTTVLNASDLEIDRSNAIYQGNHLIIEQGKTINNADLIEPGFDVVYVPSSEFTHDFIDPGFDQVDSGGEGADLIDPGFI